MVLLRKISLTNFLSHEQTDIEFNAEDKLLLAGVSGSGKSSILDAICWALYGVSRVDNRSLVRKGQTKATVVLELTNDAETVIITRSATAKGKHTLDIAIDSVAHELTGVRPLQEWIEKELIGASYLLFVNSIAYIQDNNESFVGQTATRRKELLLEIVKAGNFDVYYENAKDMLRTLGSEFDIITHDAALCTSSIHALEDTIAKRKETEASISNLLISLTETGELLKSAQEELSSTQSAGNNLNAWEQVLTSARNEEGDANKRLSEAQTLVTALVRYHAQLEDKNAVQGQIEANNSILGGLKEELNIANLNEELLKAFLQSPKPSDGKTIEVEIRQLETRMEVLKKDDEDALTCPSGDACPYREKYLESIMYVARNLAEKQGLLTIEKEALGKWEEEYATHINKGRSSQAINVDILSYTNAVDGLRNKLGELDHIQGQIDLIEPRIREIPALAILVEEKTSARQKAEEQYSKAIAANDPIKVASLKARIVTLEEGIAEINNNLASSRFILLGIEEAELEKFKKEETLDIYKKQLNELELKIEKVRLAKDAFSSNGIKATVCDYIIPVLEERINEVLGKLSDFRIRLDTQRPSADGEGVVEGLHITIVNDVDCEMSFNNYSGGEKLRITVAISESLASLTKEVGFRILDEAIHSLSQEMTSDFVHVLENLQSSYPQVLLVSHLPEVQDIFEKTIEIYKRNGISSTKETPRE